MKKLWIVLLALGLVAAFAMPAAAVEATFSGTYLIQGIYENNRSQLKPTWTLDENGSPVAPASQSSIGYIAQLLEINPKLEIVPGLTLTAQIQAMERVWGQFAVGAEDDPIAAGTLNVRNPKGEQNIQFKRVAVQFISPIGFFSVGYQPTGEWGPNFGDITDSQAGVIAYAIPIGKAIVGLGYQKVYEGRLGFYSTTLQTPFPPGPVDSDYDKYGGGITYNFPQGQLAITGGYTHGAFLRPMLVPYTYSAPLAMGPYDMGFQLLTTYGGAVSGKATFGPLYVEGEFGIGRGWWMKFDDLASWKQIRKDRIGNLLAIGAFGSLPADAPAARDIALEVMTWYLKAQYNIGPAYIGGQHAYASGDDPSTIDTQELVYPGGYGHYFPCLILFNDWLDKWSGNMGVPGIATEDQMFNNAIMYQLFAGWNPTPKLNVHASYTWAYADEKPRTGALWYGMFQTDPKGKEYLSDEYGQEFDLTATYKIYDNLEYKVGFAYLWSGDFFKGAEECVEVDNDYLFMHQLTLTF